MRGDPPEQGPDACVLDTARFFDPATQQWGYEVTCETKSHNGPTCPGEREIFRLPPR